MKNILYILLFISSLAKAQDFSTRVNNVGLTSAGTIATGVWNGTAILGQYGGTGVANTGKTITLGNNLTTSGNFALTLTSTATTNATLPAGTNTLYSTLSASITSAQLLASLSDATGTGTAVFSASPTFTGTPAAPTAANQNNTTQLATTAYVNNNFVFNAVCTSNGFSPADATTYYFGTISFVNSPGTTVNQKTFAVPTDCTLIGYVIVTTAGIIATTESSTVSVRINNTTDVQLSNAVAFNATANTQNYYYSMGLSTNLSAGDKYEIKWLTPTWTTNPTAAIMTLVLYFRSR